MPAERHVECAFLIPILRDSDRTPHQPLTWRLLEEALTTQFGGRSGPSRVYAFRSVELVPGSWIPEGATRPIEDESRLYRVAVPERRVDELRTLLRKAAKSFDQRSIYFSVTGVVEYMEPAEEDEFLA